MFTAQSAIFCTLTHGALIKFHKNITTLPRLTWVCLFYFRLFNNAMVKLWVKQNLFSGILGCWSDPRTSNEVKLCDAQVNAPKIICSRSSNTQNLCIRYMLQRTLCMQIFFTTWGEPILITVFRSFFFSLEKMMPIRLFFSILCWRNFENYIMWKIGFITVIS